ncbi:hypothetical protein [Mesorhizobium sp. B2-1-3A]|uniref:hypothetical protein n=1 Tax=Mesorhizobium sp. B2-1-3A TaxID=2589971 RepID=UPI001FEFA0F9|nr:hypothetical protein [Mesorhizobium sp. B2-1-3A]
MKRVAGRVVWGESALPAGGKTWRAAAATCDQITTAWLATAKIAQCLGSLLPVDVGWGAKGSDHNEDCKRSDVHRPGRVHCDGSCRGSDDGSDHDGAGHHNDRPSEEGKDDCHDA